MYATISPISDTVFFLNSGVTYSQNSPTLKMINKICHSFVISLLQKLSITLQYAIKVILPIKSLK